jgi:hypothetical protein
VAVEEIPDDEHETHRYYSCPILFTTSRSIDFYRRYKAIKDGLCGAREYGEEDAWFMDAVEYYDKWYAYCLKRKNPDPSGSNR